MDVPELKGSTSFEQQNGKEQLLSTATATGYYRNRKIEKVKEDVKLEGTTGGSQLDPKGKLRSVMACLRASQTTSDCIFEEEETITT